MPLFLPMMGRAIENESAETAVRDGWAQGQNSLCRGAKSKSSGPSTDSWKEEDEAASRKGRVGRGRGEQNREGHRLWLREVLTDLR